MSSSQEKSGHILFCVLNWGLGHATRSIPIIRMLLSRGFDVTLASDGRAEALLRAEFPHLIIHSLPSYDVRYAFKSMFFNMLYQWPKVMLSIIQEYFSVKRLNKLHHYDAIISDNRYGCFQRKTRSVCITHQINPMTSLWLTDRLGKWISHLLLSNFHIVWIPDDPDLGCLAGPMVDQPPKHSKFIGFISRFTPNYGHADTKAKTDITIILSGPEPLRTDFELKVMAQMAHFNGTWVLVRGKTEGQMTWQQLSPAARSIDYLTSQELEKLIKSSKFIVSRSGYTSLMDYLVVGSKALVVPTPGQYEQEYLAKNIPAGMPFIGSEENEMDIRTSFTQMTEMPTYAPYKNDQLTVALDDLLTDRFTA